MPNEFFFTEPDRVRCMQIKVPVVIAEAEAQVVVDTTFCLPELAKKVDHIDVMVQGLEADPVFVHENPSSWNISMSKKWPHHFNDVVAGAAFVKKVIVHGILHKQIYYVNQEDHVKHVGEDIPFTKMIELPEPEPVIDVDDVEVQFHGTKADVTWDLVRASRLQQTGVIMVRVKVVEQRQIFVQVCPPPDICPRGVNILRDPGFEQWIANTPLIWGATNVFRAEGRTNGFAAGLGLDPTLPAAVFQTTNRVLHNNMYRFCFWAQRLQILPPNCDFTLEAQISFFDSESRLIDTQTESWDDTQVPTTWRQFCLDAGPVQENTAYALVRIAFMPAVGVTPPNNCQVAVDDASLVCVTQINR